MRIRERHGDSYSLTGVENYYNKAGSLLGSWTYGPWSYFQWREVTQDEQHAWPRKRDATYDLGGPFLRVKTSFDTNWRMNDWVSLNKVGAFDRRTYEGNLGSDAQIVLGHPSRQLRADMATSVFLADIPHDSLSVLNALGTKAISATIPTNPHADVSVGIAELMREGLPSLIGTAFLKDRSSFFRSLGSEYLNVEFGWKPLLKDLRDVSKSIVDSERLLAQLARDSGRQVRRRTAFPKWRETTIASSALQMYAGPTSDSLISQTHATQVTKSLKETWFSGAYVYHYDPAALSRASEIATKARHLLGLKLDPEVLWNLAPWSWLVDWFTDIGPVLHNLTAFQQDQLVLRYGYLMQHNVKSVEWTGKATLLANGSIPTRTPRSLAVTEVKERIRATPYGFGLSTAAFTARQWSILGALGITRAPRQL